MSLQEKEKEKEGDNNDMKNTSDEDKEVSLLELAPETEWCLVENEEEKLIHQCWLALHEATLLPTQVSLKDFKQNLTQLKKEQARHHYSWSQVLDLIHFFWTWSSYGTALFTLVRHRPLLYSMIRLITG